MNFKPTLFWNFFFFCFRDPRSRFFDPLLFLKKWGLVTGFFIFRIITGVQT